MIREMSGKDIPDCVDVIRKSFKTVADDMGFTPENAPFFTAFATDENRLSHQFNEEKRPMYVLVCAGKIAGYYSLAFPAEGEAELNNLAVLPEYRHRGFGKDLLNDSFVRAKGFGRSVLKIGIVEENKVLRKWYESNGFVHTGTKKFDFFPFTCGYLQKKL